MEARVEDERLPGDHAPPAEGSEGCVHFPGTAADKPFKYYTGRVGYDAPGCYEDGPEVESVAALEGGEDFEVDEEGHVDCES